jgi:hypothetical protein
MFTSMTKLSPAAQAVLDAVHGVMADTSLAELRAIAAALRALTRTSLTEEAHICGWFCSAVRTDDILAIADELER